MCSSEIWETSLTISIVGNGGCGGCKSMGKFHVLTNFATHFILLCSFITWA